MSNMKVSERSSGKESTLPLCTGDRLNRNEFEVRYDAMPPGVKADLIDGVAYVMASPVSARSHAEPHFDFNGWLFVYRAHTPQVRGGDNASLRLDMDNEPQPDGYLRLLPEFGGRSRIVDEFLVEAPELIVEIAASSASYDLHDKLVTYRRHGVREYIVWRVWDKAIDWFVLKSRRYEKLAATAQGILQSRIFPGLWLDPAAVIRGDITRVLSVLGEGLASAEHEKFVAARRK